MVLDDPNYEPKSNKPLPPPEKFGLEEAFASPADRLAASIIDICSVLMPVGLLAVAPFRRRLAESLLLQQESDSLLVGVLAAIVFFTLIWLYQTLMHWKFGATIGKLLFGIKVVQSKNFQKPSLIQSALRSFLWIFETLLLFPQLSVLAHSERRTLHDRVSDTLVVCPRRPVGPPEFWEKSFVGGFYAALIVFFALTAIGMFKGLLDELDDQSKLIALLEQNGELCSSVGKAIKTWPEEKVSYGSERLSVAMAMFAAGIISKTCLTQEADYLSSQLKDEEPLLYLAQSFIQSDNAKLSNEYLDRVCKLDEKSNSCIMSKIITSWADEDWEKVDLHFSKLEANTHLHIAVWAIRHLMRQQRFFEALAYIDVISPQKSLAPFLNSQRVKAYWNLNRFAEARAAASASFDLMDLYDSVEVAGWLCQQELEQGCEKQTAISCRTLDYHMQGSQDLMVDPQLALAQVRQLECGENAQPELEKLLTYLPQPRLKSYVQAILLNLQGESNDARVELQRLAKDKLKDDVGLLARRRLIEWADSSESIDKYYDEWTKAESEGEPWVKLGKSLFDKYHSLGLHIRSVEIGRRLLQTPVADAEFYRSLVLSAYQSGNRREAKILLRAYRSLDPDLNIEERIPASEGEFEVIARLLEQEQGSAK